jgi:drug/metabolite transporter (DMT)-like permease
VSLAMSLITYAEKLGIGSGLAATVVVTAPMWVALWAHIGGERASRLVWVGMALGAAGALLLALEGDFTATPLGAILAFSAPLFWSLGSYASRKFALPAPAMASAAEWTVGGVALLVVALAVEPGGVPAMFEGSARSWAAWGYLVVFGTLIAFNAYLWLLGNTTASVATSYAFANPAVALVAGAWLNAEQLTGWIYVALPLIFAALAIILYGPQLLAAVSKARARAQWGEVKEVQR